MLRYKVQLIDHEQLELDKNTDVEESPPATWDGACQSHYKQSGLRDSNEEFKI